jgi:hypothetical protein
MNVCVTAYLHICMNIYVFMYQYIGMDSRPTTPLPLAHSTNAEEKFKELESEASSTFAGKGSPIQKLIFDVENEVFVMSSEVEDVNPLLSSFSSIPDEEESDKPEPLKSPGIYGYMYMYIYVYMYKHR